MDVRMNQTLPAQPTVPTVSTVPTVPPGAETVGPTGHDHRFSSEPRAGFEVHLAVFDGPFDLLLGLIAKHELDITAVSLSTVTDEFIAFIKAMGPVWDLDRTSEFLVIAATLVDLKAARLLPAAEVEDEDDLALLEARDLLFARLLQYRAYKEVSAIFAAMLAAESRRYPRAVGPEPRFAGVAARGAPRAWSPAIRRARRSGADSAPTGGRVRRSPPQPDGECAGASCDPSGPAASVRHGDVSVTHGRLHSHGRDRGPIPGSAGSVP